MSAINVGILNNSNITKVIAELFENSSEYKPFTAAEERKFIADNINNPDLIKSELIKRNIRLVISMSKKYALTTTNYDDLLQNGFLGLVKASEKFDFNAKIRFCTYAGWWIRKYILAPYYDKYESKIKYNSFNLDVPLSSNNGSTINNTDSIIDSYIDPSYNKSSYNINDELYSMDKVELVNIISSNIKESNELSSIDKSVYKFCLLKHYTIKDTSKIIKVPTDEITKSKRKVNQYIKKFLKNEFNILNYNDI